VGAGLSEEGGGVNKTNDNKINSWTFLTSLANVHWREVKDRVWWGGAGKKEAVKTRKRGPITAYPEAVFKKNMGYPYFRCKEEAGSGLFGEKDGHRGSCGSSVRIHRAMDETKKHRPPS